MKRLQILVVGLVMLALVCAFWLERARPTQILSSHTFVDVDAPADKVWKVLTDLPTYPGWNPYIVDASGSLKTGEKLHLVERLDGTRHWHTVRVTRYQPADRELIWQGSLVPAKLLTWNEGFTVEALDASHSRVSLLQSHQGVLAELYWKYNKNRCLDAFKEFGSALKKKAEQ